MVEVINLAGVNAEADDPKGDSASHRPKPKWLEFSWSWLSIPSLLLAWMLVATQFPSYILPQVWEVAEEVHD